MDADAVDKLDAILREQARVRRLLVALLHALASPPLPRPVRAIATNVLTEAGEPPVADYRGERRG